LGKAAVAIEALGLGPTRFTRTDYPQVPFSSSRSAQKIHIVFFKATVNEATRWLLRLDGHAGVILPEASVGLVGLDVGASVSLAAVGEDVGPIVGG